MTTTEQHQIFKIELLTKNHDRSQFDCGNTTLTNYLKQQARQDRDRNIAVPYVLVRDGDPKVIGYYTLSTFAVTSEDIPITIAKKLPKYGLIPAIILGRLAVDSDFQGEGLGGLLLVDAFLRAYRASHTIGAFALVVDAIDEDARRFYLKHEFIDLQSAQNRLFLPMKTIKELLNRENLLES